MNDNLFIFIPLIGYAGLWLLASPLFVAFFKLFHVAIDLKHTVRMIKQVPSALAIVTVPACSFASYFATTKVTVHLLHAQLTGTEALQVGLISLVAAIILDALITILGEKIDIRKFPLNLMYLLAYLTIIPAVLIGT